MTSLLDLGKDIVDLLYKVDTFDAQVQLLLLLAWVLLPPCLLWVAFRSQRLTMLMRCLPTSKVRSVFIGLSEVKGVAQRAKPLVSRLAEEECMWYSYTVEEEWEREKTEISTDSNGKTESRTVTERGWTVVDEFSSEEPFELVDDSGSICVRPQGATIEAEKFLHNTCDRSSSMYFGKGPRREINGTTHRRRFTERGIRPNAALYIIGTTRLQENAIHPEFADSNAKDPYLISIRNEARITCTESLKAVVLPIGGLAMMFLPSFFWENCGIPKNIYNPDFDFLHQSVWLHAAVIYVACWVILFFWQWYGEMVAARNRVAQGVAQVAVQLQRRHDLIQQLVGVVEAYCRHEQGLMERVGELRRQVEEGQLKLLAEAYPELKAQTLFAKLQQELSDTEERLALAREYRNDIGNYYNTRLRVFPGGLVLRLLGFSSFRQS